ncbi:MAG: HdeD family acid-resistance protein [Hyphomicrobiaceae bacterium]
MTQVEMPALRPPFPALHALAENWWLILLRGICAIVFGVLTLLWPGLPLVTLILFFGAFAFVDGVLAIIAAIRGDNPAPRWWLGIVGLLGIAAGALTFLWPGLTGLVLLFFIAGWAIAGGVMQIIGAIRLRNEIPDEWWLIGSGVLSVVFGILVLMYPGAGALGLSLAIGAFAFVYGIMLIPLSLRLRKHIHAPPHKA